MTQYEITHMENLMLRNDYWERRHPDVMRYCDVCDCIDCPRYGDDCDGDERRIVLVRSDGSVVYED